MIKQLFSLIFISLAISCSSSGKKVLTPAPLHNSPDLEQLTYEGDNDHAQVSGDGQQIIFASKSRPAHRSTQIYELNLAQQKLRRLTFNDAETVAPGFIPDNKQIYYMSTTDELKERGPNRPGEKNHSDLTQIGFHPAFGPFEIYSSSADGESIERLTFHRGFDGYPAWESDNIFYFISQEKSQYLIQKSSSGKITSLFKSPQAIADLAYSPSEKSWAWVQLDNKEESTSLIIAKKSVNTASIISLPPGYYKDPSWLYGNNQLLLAGKLNTDKDFDIFHLDLNSNCLQKVIALNGDDSSPAVDHKNSFIVFVNNVEKQRHIYKKLFNFPNGTCL